MSVEIGQVLKILEVFKYIAGLTSLSERYFKFENIVQTTNMYNCFILYMYSLMGVTLPTFHKDSNSTCYYFLFCFFWIKYCLFLLLLVVRGVQ